MATLDGIRTGYLNLDLGLTGDSDDRFGDDDTRNLALQDAIRRMWPRMAQLTTQTITPTDDTTSYSLTSIREVIRIELFDTDGNYINDFAGNYRTRETLSAATYSISLLLPHEIDTSLSLVVTGYKPFTVPTSTPPASSGTHDIPDELVWIAVAGARSFLYRRQTNQFAVFERHENENRKTFLSVEQMLGLANDAERMFQSGVNENRRKYTAIKRRATRSR